MQRQIRPEQGRPFTPGILDIDTPSWNTARSTATGDRDRYAIAVTTHRITFRHNAYVIMPS